jgi:hypothetical protein
VRAEAAAFLAGTPSEPSEAEGASGEGRAAASDEEPQEHSRHIPSKEARDRDLRLKTDGVI